MRIVKTFASSLALLGGVLIILCAFLITIDVVTRLFVGQIYLNSFELSRLIFAAAVALSLGYAAVERAHIRIDLAIKGLSAPYRSGAGIVAFLTLGIVGSYLAVRGADLFMHSWRINARPVANVPVRLWVPQGVWLVGLISFASISFFVALVAASHALFGRWEKAEALVGTPSVNDELSSTVPRSIREPGREK